MSPFRRRNIMNTLIIAGVSSTLLSCWYLCLLLVQFIFCNADFFYPIPRKKKMGALIWGKSLVHVWIRGSSTLTITYSDYPSSNSSSSCAGRWAFNEKKFTITPQGFECLLMTHYKTNCISNIYRSLFFFHVLPWRKSGSAAADAEKCLKRKPCS